MLHDLRTRGGNEEKRCLVCTECKRTFTPTKKILEGFDNACKILDSPMINPTLAGKKEFIYHGLPVETIVSKLNEASGKHDSEMYKYWVRKMNLEVAKGMFHLNIHHWKHFESCFKYSKKRNKKTQECRYKKPDWPTTVQKFLSFQIDSNGKVQRLSFSTQQRPPFIFLSESVTRLMITELCNHCVKLVETPQLGFYWSSYSTKGQFNNSKSIIGLLNNMKSIIVQNITRVEKGLPIKSDYKQGMSYLAKAANKFNDKSIIGAPMAAFCLLNGDRFIFSQTFVPLLPWQAHQWLVSNLVSGFLNSKREIKETISHYPNRNTDLEHLSWYEFLENYEICANSYFPKKNRKKDFKIHGRTQWRVQGREVLLFSS